MGMQGGLEGWKTSGGSGRSQADLQLMCLQYVLQPVLELSNDRNVNQNQRLYGVMMILKGYPQRLLFYLLLKEWQWTTCLLLKVAGQFDGCLACAPTQAVPLGKWVQGQHITVWHACLGCLGFLPWNSTIYSGCV